MDKDSTITSTKQPFEIKSELLETEFAQTVNVAEDVTTDTRHEESAESLLINPVEALSYLIDPIIPRVGVGCLAGASDTGKSQLLRQLGIWIVMGYARFLCFEIHAKYKKAIIVCTEDERNAVSYLLKRQAGSTAPSALKGLRFIFDWEDLLSKLDASLTADPADIIIIDCFSDPFNGDLKDSQKIRQYVNQYQKLAEKHQCFILFLHHTGKRTENFEPSKNNLLSGQGFDAKMRLIIELRQDAMDSAKRHFCIVKGNYLPAHMKKESFVLDFSEDTFTFTASGDRVPFEHLVKKDPNQDEKTKFELAFKLKNEGKTTSEIAKAVGYGSKGSVSKLFARAQEKGWVSDTVSFGNDGND